MSASLGVTLDGWQETILKAAMGERGGRWAAMRVGVCVPRQNGKSQLMVARILAGALLFGEKKIVVSAHQQETAREAFSKLLEIIEDDRNGALRERLDPRFGRGGVMNAINREAVRFRTQFGTSMVQFKARTGAGGKGFSSDCLLLDEAQILGSRAWTSINSTMSAMPNPQVWLLGTSPQDEDDSFAFDAVRASVLKAKSSNAAWCEWGVDRDSPEYRAAADDLAAKRWSPAVEYLCWAGNPAWLTRVNHDTVVGECETYEPAKFGQDRLGIWPATSGLPPVLSADEWSRLRVDVPGEGSPAYGVKFSPDGARVSLAVAVRGDEGPTFVEVIDSRSTSSGNARLIEFLVERWRESMCLVVDGKSGAGALVEALLEAGVKSRWIIRPTLDQVVTAHSSLLDAVREGRLSHAGQPGLTESVAHAARRDIGTNGGWGFKPTAPDADVTLIESVTMAHYGATTSKRRSSRSSGRAVFA